jgi:hypothetical protein
MGEGIQYIRSLPSDFSVDLLRLRSPAPVALPAVRGGGAVTDPGEIGNSSVKGVKVSLRGPSWLVLGQGFSEGWQADCDGRDLGKPRPIDGYGNGWRAPADCKDVAFTYGPQRAAKVGYAISAGVCALLLAFLLLGLRRRPPRPVAAPPLLPPLRAPRRLALPRAAALALVLTVPLALLFAKRTSVVIFPLLTLILWRGASARLLTAGAALLLGVAVPLLYLIENPINRGGYNFEYSLQTINAHWVTEGALVLLMVACWRTIAEARAARGVSPPTAPQAAPAPPEPAAAQSAGAAPARSTGA